MSEQLQHPTLDGRPVMIGDLLEVDDPPGHTTTVQFRVASITWDPTPHGGGATVRSIDHSVERHLRDCRRVRAYRPTDLIFVETYSYMLGTEPAFGWRVVENRTGDVLAVPLHRLSYRAERDAQVQLLWPDLAVVDRR